MGQAKRLEIGVFVLRSSREKSFRWHRGGTLAVFYLLLVKSATWSATSQAVSVGGQGVQQSHNFARAHLAP